MMADEKIQQIHASARAVVFERFGQPQEILQIKALDVPVPAEGQVLIRMRAASINPIDWKISSGMFKNWPISFPKVVGWDGSGVVAKVGPGVQTLKPGDEVFFDNGGGGTFAEYAIAKAIQCAIKPKKLSWEEAAGAPVVFMTAYQCLKVHPVKSGTRVLVLGGTSSVGTSKPLHRLRVFRLFIFVWHFAQAWQAYNSLSTTAPGLRRPAAPAKLRPCALLALI